MEFPLKVNDFCVVTRDNPLGAHLYETDIIKILEINGNNESYGVRIVNKDFEFSSEEHRFTVTWIVHEEDLILHAPENDIRWWLKHGIT